MIACLLSVIHTRSRRRASATLCNRVRIGCLLAAGLIFPVVDPNPPLLMQGTSPLFVCCVGRCCSTANRAHEVLQLPSARCHSPTETKKGQRQQHRCTATAVIYTVLAADGHARQARVLEQALARAKDSINIIPRLASSPLLIELRAVSGVPHVQCPQRGAVTHKKVQLPRDVQS